MSAQNRVICRECGQGTRDMWLRDRHRTWGSNVPMMDMDGLLWEYDNRLVIGLIEYKHKHAARLEGAELETILTTAERLAVPAYEVRYLDDDDEPLFHVEPLNPLGRLFGHPSGWVSEDDYIRFLHEIRGRTVSEWDAKTIKFNRRRLRRIRRESAG